MEDQSPHLFFRASSPVPFYLKPLIPDDFSHLDPISFVAPEPHNKQCHQNLPQATPLYSNPNRHLVPDDLQQLIKATNPHRGIKFTYSQRLNTQMVLDEYVLKKKKGPYMARGGRAVNWRCINDKCQYTTITWEGKVMEAKRYHNHPAQPELYAKKQARFKLRENMTGHMDQPASNLVEAVVENIHPEMRDMVGSMDALKQAARRYTRKMRGVVPRPRSGDGGSRSHSRSSTFLPIIPGLDPDTKDFEIINSEGTRQLNAAQIENIPFTPIEITNGENTIVKLERDQNVQIEVVEEVNIDFLCDLESRNIDVNKDKIGVVDEILDEAREESHLGGNFESKKLSSSQEISLRQASSEEALLVDCPDNAEESLEPSPSKPQPLEDEIDTGG